MQPARFPTLETIITKVEASFKLARPDIKGYVGTPTVNTFALVAHYCKVMLRERKTFESKRTLMVYVPTITFVVSQLT